MVFSLPNKLAQRSFLYLFGILFLALAIGSSFMLKNYHETLTHERQEKAQRMVENALSLIAYYQGKVDRGEMTPEKAQSYALDTIRQITMEPNGYYWVIDTYPRGVMHPVRLKWDGSDLSTYVGPDGKRVFVDMVELTKRNGAGFISYYWTKPNLSDEKLYPKTSYVKLFKPWNWIVGTGVYIDDINYAFWNAVIVACGLTIAVLMFVMALAMTVSESLKKS